MLCLLFTSLKSVVSKLLPDEAIIKLVADVGIEPNVEFLPSGYEPDEIDLFSNPQ